MPAEARRSAPRVVRRKVSRTPPSDWSAAILPYLRIVRAPAVFSALGDPLAGLLVAGGALSGSRASRLSAAAGLIYLAGMALNDYADRDEDARARPDRPIPSGTISPRTAALVGGSLLLGGVALAHTAGARWTGPALAALVVAYDFPLKHSSALGPIAMGACRSASLLMGVEAAARGPLGRQGGEQAVMLGAYVAGLTLIARSETGVARSAELRGGALLVGAALLASVVRGGARSLPWGALAAALAGPAVARALRAPGPSTVGPAVGALVRAIPALDGSLASTSAPVPTLVLASLLGLARWGRVLIPIT